MSKVNTILGAGGVMTGAALVFAGIAWLLTLLAQDLNLALIRNIPLPDSPERLALILSVCIWGGFTYVWGTAVLRYQEWGAFSAGLVHLMSVILLVAAFVFFLLHPEIVFAGEGRMSFYNRWFWLIWTGVAALFLWLLGMTYWLIIGNERREMYARAHQDRPAPILRICDRCGLLLDKQGSCRECNRRRRTAFLFIGDRPESLYFVDAEAGNVKIVGKSGGSADILIRPEDVAQPEGISRRQFAVQYHFDAKQFTIEDINSLNGTRLNGVPLRPNERYPLKRGDRIEVAGQLEMLFEPQEAKAEG